jgi:hypothetical protein
MSVVELTAVLGNIGEFVGSLAVLATLIYLSVQVKEAKEALLADSRDQRASRALDIFLTAADSDHIVSALVAEQESSGVRRRAFVQSLMDRGISAEDAERLRFFYSAWNRHYETLWRSPLSEDERRSIASNIRFTFAAGTGPEFWNTTASKTTSKDYAKFVEQAIAADA